MTDDKRPGRPRLYDEPRQRLTIELPPELVKRVDAAADAQQISRTRLIEQVMDVYMEEWEQLQAK